MRVQHQTGQLLASLTLAGLLAGCHNAREVRLDRETYEDKCRGAWAGQMIGVSYGAPTEFQYNGRIIEGPLPEWKPERIRNAIGQDDCYVEITWLEALEEYGLDITWEQAGLYFAKGEYDLAHANRYGRENIRHGIMPPMSGHPQYNRHADDIDFQIESDVLGIICPAMPRASNRLCHIFGHIMNYGDGVYGGMFVAGMYTAAFTESRDVRQVVEAGLACIPAESQYARCIADVIRWYDENPDDWKAAWRKIEDKWQDDIDCTPGNPFNIDAKLNGAYVVVGLLYGEGDFGRTMEIATRCGQDSDCNPSTAAGVLGCMKGFSALDRHDARYTAGLDAIADEKFAHTRYSYNELIPACRRMAEKIIVANGGRIEQDAYIIRALPPQPPPLEQWENQMEIISVVIPQFEVDRWDPAWRIVACGYEYDPGYVVQFAGRQHALHLSPVSESEPAVLEGRVAVPDKADPKLAVPVSSFGDGDFVMKVYADDRLLFDQRIDTEGRFKEYELELHGEVGRSVKVRIEMHAHGDWHWERGYFGRVEVQ